MSLRKSRAASWMIPRPAAAGDQMLSLQHCLLVLIRAFALLWLGANTCLAQGTIANFQRVLDDKAGLEQTDVAALDRGETVVKLLPGPDKREIALCGMIRLQSPAEIFLQSFQENMARKSSPAILEIGNFSNPPSLEDLQGLTIEDRDIEDLRQCVVGDCRLKLSAIMIARLQKEVDWASSNYRDQVTQLLKQMLLDYLRDYQARGDAALIQYDDKDRAIRLADEQRQLLSVSTYDSLVNFAEAPKETSKPELTEIQTAFVWSKIKFGLKPVIAINHIKIYRRAQKLGAQILIVSKQIYANHYFDSSLALTAFLNIPGPNPGSYLFYENRSRVDGLAGPFGRIKRGIVEDAAMAGLKSVLSQSQARLNNRALNAFDTRPAAVEQNVGRWKFRKLHLFLLVWIIIVVMFIVMCPYSAKSIIVRRHIQG